MNQMLNPSRTSPCYCRRFYYPLCLRVAANVHIAVSKTGKRSLVLHSLPFWCPRRFLDVNNEKS